MKRAVFKLKDGEFINVPADAINRQDEWICAWQGEDIVAIAKAEIVKQIFEEIEKRLLSYSTPTFNDKNKAIIQLNTDIYESLAELKKKYIGE